MDILPTSFKDWPIILEINLVLGISFLILAFMLLCVVFYLRIYKNMRNSRKEKLEILLLDFINNYLFNDEFDKSKEIMEFGARHLKTGFDRKIALKQLLIFHENLKGESSALIKELFFGLGLYNFLISDLTKAAWYNKARALFVFCHMDVKIPEELVEPLINSNRNEVRQQAILYLLNQPADNPLGFLDKVDRGLTLWQQIYMEDSLKNYPGDMPDFSKWLDHKIASVVIFCLKMIADHNQFENTPAMLKLIDHPDPGVRQQAIISLRKMEVQEMLPILIHNFPRESTALKQEILKTIREIGSEKELQLVAPSINSKDRALKIDYLRIARYFNPKIAGSKLKAFNTDQLGLSKLSL
ncbi:MAG: HEAT repeat domain-containing protein [Sediminicola sp.]